VLVVLRPEGPSEHAWALQHVLCRAVTWKTRAGCYEEGYSPAQTNTGEKGCAAIKMQDFSPRRDLIMLHHYVPTGRQNLPHLDSTE